MLLLISVEKEHISVIIGRDIGLRVLESEFQGKSLFFTSQLCDLGQSIQPLCYLNSLIY